jgi:hypothetical protein
MQCLNYTPHRLTETFRSQILFHTSSSRKKTRRLFLCFLLPQILGNNIMWPTGTVEPTSTIPPEQTRLAGLEFAELEALPVANGVVEAVSRDIDGGASDELLAVVIGVERDCPASLLAI